MTVVRLSLLTTLLITLCGPALAATPVLKMTVRDSDSLRRYQLESGKWVQRGVVDLKLYPTKRQRYFRKLLPGPRGQIWLATDRQLIEVDAAFKAHLRYTAPSGTYIGAFARYSNSHWLVALGGRLVVLNNSFQKIASLRLLKSDRKSAHEIMIQGRVAYILDNIYVPIWAFRVGLDVPKQPKLLQTINFAGVNVHLSMHWINKTKKVWSIVRDQSVLDSMSQQVFHYNLGDPQVPRIGVDTLFYYSRRKGRLRAPNENRRLLAVTSDGSWGLMVTYGSGEVTLLRLRWQSGVRASHRSRVIGVKARWYAQAKLATTKGSLVFWVNKTLMLWDITTPKLARPLLKTAWSTPVHALLLSR